MRCSLKLALGVRAHCQREECVYWRLADSESGRTRPQCMLQHFNLTGKHPDRLAKWLFYYKLSAARARHASLLRASHGERAAHLG